jgi:hypothetical protein
MKYLILMLVTLTGCLIDPPQGPPGPILASSYRITPLGHYRTGPIDPGLDSAVDLGFSNFATTFPELYTSVNRVSLLPGDFWYDGGWCVGAYTDGEDYIAVSEQFPQLMSAPRIPHELLHTVIGDPHHKLTQYWNRLPQAVGSITTGWSPFQ